MTSFDPKGGPGNTVVTGATGFIGRHLVEKLRRAGNVVHALSRSTGFDLVHDELPLDGIDHVYHLAGQTFVPQAWSNPIDFHLVNAHGTVRVLDQCRRNGVSVTYASAYVYGNPATLPIREDADVRLNNPYAFSKYAGEEACRFYSNIFNLPVTIFRIFNVFGPGQDDRFLIPMIMRQVRDPKVAIIEVADLSPRRDYVYVDDVSEALLLSPRLLGGTYNVGSGRSYSVEELVQKILATSCSDKTYRQTGSQRNNEINDVVADTAALQKIGWQASFSLENGLRAMWDEINK
ncbi:NAD-dependent epimerase/dehydratase family protein [Bradyrhizobium sp. CB1650]|uniref:NAD-dependent epimerase/dehydratase family protein n=1 Tax=Bradyrhizobium sp. CB1650 TaxID=3039153 RepID=UPI002435D6A6|nr:NAD-dependent epimerase/dehydratase family protein [Bradyrhizobium sp. CB1650]WGD55346.1 NAD-dependent epimerase/dehydratase family protein [Bradyrhizobium sp. CB1650]